jgi:G8 domain
LLAALPLVLTLFPSAGLAPPEGPICRDTWISPSSGSWHVAEDWDQGLPDENDTVCIPAGVTVTYSTGTQSVQSLQVAGALAISGGTLKTTSTVDESTVGTQFNILGGLRFGQFASVEGDLLPNGSWYAPHYNPANVLLVVQRGLSLRR